MVHTSSNTPFNTINKSLFNMVTFAVSDSALCMLHTGLTMQQGKLSTLLRLCIVLCIVFVFKKGEGRGPPNLVSPEIEFVYKLTITFEPKSLIQFSHGMIDSQLEKRGVSQDTNCNKLPTPLLASMFAQPQLHSDSGSNPFSRVMVFCRY